MCVLLVASVFAAYGITIEHMRPFTDEDLECMTYSDGAIFVGASDEHVYISADDGRSWKDKTMARADGSISAMLHTSDGAIIVGVNSWDVHYISVSTDRGVTWHREWRDDDIAVKTLVQLTKGTVAAIGDEEVYVRSIPGSGYQDWKEPMRPWYDLGGLMPGIDVQDSYQFPNGDILLVGESAFSACFDLSFTYRIFACSVLNEAIDYTGVDFLDDTDGCVGSDEGSIFRTSDRGRTWAPVYVGSVSISDIAFSGPECGVTVGDDGLLLISVDGGMNWGRADTGVQTDFNFVKRLRDGRFVAGGDEGHWMAIKF